VTWNDAHEPLEALAPEAFEVGVFGARHGLAPGLVEGYQPNRIATLARLVFRALNLLGEWSRGSMASS
jgi:hypothetical protein